MGERLLWLLALAGLVGSAAVLLRQRRDRPAAGRLDGEDTLVPHADAGGRLQAGLEALDIRLRPALFLGGAALTGGAVVLVFLSLFPERTALAIAAGMALIPTAGLVLRDLVVWRAHQLEGALADVVDVMQAAVAGGTPPRLALELASQSVQGIARTAIAALVRRLELGASAETATAPLLRRYPSEGVRLFADTLTGHWHTGGDFAALLAALGRILRARRRHRQRLQAQLSGARYALVFAIGFPYLLVPFFLWREPAWLAPLTTHPLGPAAMLSALLCQVAGVLWMRRILRSDD